MFKELLVRVFDSTVWSHHHLRHSLQRHLATYQTLKTPAVSHNDKTCSHHSSLLPQQLARNLSPLVDTAGTSLCWIRKNQALQTRDSSSGEMNDIDDRTAQRRERSLIVCMHFKTYELV